MSNNLLGAKLHFKKLYEKDNGFIERFGTTEQKEFYLPGLCKMELMASYCLTEPGKSNCIDLYCD